MVKKPFNDVSKFLINTKDNHYLEQALNTSPKKIWKFYYYKDHYTFLLKSDNNSDKYVCTNFTSTPFIKTYFGGTDKFVELACIAEINPNLKNESKSCYLARFYQTECFDSSKVGYLPDNIYHKMLENVQTVTLALALYCGEDILSLTDKRLEFGNNNFKVIDFLKKHNFPIAPHIILYLNYINANRNYFANPINKIKLQDYVKFESQP